MSKELKKELGLLDIFCISTGAMISSGLFIIPGLAYAQAGPAVVLSYFIAGLFCLPTLFSMSELTTAMPKAGGAYFYIMRGFGPLFGTIAGLSMWFSLSLKGTFALVGMGMYLTLVAKLSLSPSILALLSCMVFVAVNLFSTKDAGRVQVFIVIGLLGILALYVGWGSQHVIASNMSGFFDKGAGAIFATASYVFISYGGLVKVAALAEETDNPGRNLPLGMILSLIVTSIVYALVVWVTIGVSTDLEALKNTYTPITDSAKAFGDGGNILVTLIAFAAFFAFISTANSGIMAASRYPLGMSRDKLIPDFFQKISPKLGTPYISIIFTGIFMVLFVFLELTLLVKVASSLLILLYIFVNLTVILFRESHIQGYKPTFTSPLYPYMQVIGILGGGFLLVEMGTKIVFMTMMFVALGFVWYNVYAKKRGTRDSALIYLLQKLVERDKELASDNILSELKDIVIQRDEVIRDKVHKLFDESVVLDIDEPKKMESFFNIISEMLAEELGIDPDALVEKFVHREMTACTVVRDRLAIPHVIIEGEGIFRIIMARAKSGVIFPGDKLAHIIFVTVGSADKRNLHLKVLAAIAQITQDPEFDSKWMKVGNKEDLKHLVLLAERKRG